MAKENESDIRWMTEQRDRLKQEVDVLNPKCDALEARLSIHQRDLLDATAKVENLSSRTASAEFSNAELVATVKKTADINEHLAAELTIAKNLAEQRRLALADIMDHASSLISKVMPLLNQ